MSEIEKQLSPSLVGSRFPNDGKHPCLKDRLPIESRPPFQDLEIDGLKDTFSVPGISPTTTHRPAVTLRMEFFKLCFEYQMVH